MNHFINGLLRVFSFGRLPKDPVVERYDVTRPGYDPEQVDRDALRSDWEAIGNDFRKVMGDGAESIHL